MRIVTPTHCNSQLDKFATLDDTSRIPEHPPFDPQELPELCGRVMNFQRQYQSSPGGHPVRHWYTSPVKYSLIPSVRPPASSSELTVIHDSLYNTLSSTAESANVLISKVISARADQHAKLDFREFLEMFNECWNFVVRCEIICRRMIVGLRGAVVSQVQVEARTWKCDGLTYLDRPSHSSRRFIRLESASLLSSSRTNSGHRPMFQPRYNISSTLSWMPPSTTRGSLSLKLKRWSLRPRRLS
jgi:hypothetical protein